MNKGKCELLVPAGGVEQFIAAVENGVDAVYIGGHLFNARINAGNFSDEELQAAVDFAHKRSVKVFVTMNTLMTDDELDGALKYAAFLYEAGVDALIIQDLGLGKLIREYMPDFPLHLSTQATVCDAMGAETALRLGYERVVLSRELSLAEIRQICSSTEADIEVFVHGALCVCYSGQCQLSRYFGGRSGNRGLCAQPCRLPYMTFDEKGKPVDTVRYPLSPKDQCLIDHLGDLADAGVLSFKIEGRMKSAEYVAVVTSIYRKYLDLYYEKGRYTVDPADRLALEQIFNRGGFTDGYYHGDSSMDIMSGDLPKHQGIRIGKVIKRIQGTALVDVKLYDELSLGDGVEIQSKELCGNVVTYYKELKGGLTRIGDIRGRVEHGDPLFRISRKSQLEHARATYENVGFDAGKYLRKGNIDMELIANGDRLRLVVKHKSGASVFAEGGPYGGGEVPTEVSRFEKALRKTGNTPFKAEKIDFEGELDATVKTSEINELRRRALSQMEEALITRRTAPMVQDYIPLTEEKTPVAIELYYYSWKSYREHFVPPEVERSGLPLVSLVPLVEFHRHRAEVGTVIPYISNVSRGSEDAYIEENFDSIADLCRDTGVYVGSLGWIQPFRFAGVDVFGDYGLNVMNSQSEAALDAIGVRRCVGSLESAVPAQGPYPLMTMQHQPQGDILLNKGRDRLVMIHRDFSDQTLLVSENYSISSDEIPSGPSEVMRIYIA